MLRALIFDFDGLILDTEHPGYMAWSETYQSFGLTLTIEDWAALIGRGAFAPPRTPCHHIEEQLGNAIDHATVLAKRHQRYAEQMVSIAALPGVEELLADAERHGLKVGLASSSSREWVIGYLDRLGLTDRFSVICCGDEVANIKPAPDVYLATLERLGVSADEAVALEDSPIGTAAAKAAGLYCIAVPNIVTQYTSLAAADIQVASLKDVSVAMLDGMRWVTSIVREEIRSATPVPCNEINKVFRLECSNRTLFLKVGPNLEREYHRLRWLQGRLPAPEPLGWTNQEAVDALLMTLIEGDSLSKLSVSLAPQDIIVRLAAALKRMHAQSIADWPFGGDGTVLVHGDACLPNFLFRGDPLSGYIDVGDMALATPEVDLAAAVWSLQNNLGPGHGLAFLREYGWENADEDEVERLRRQYETA